eukprot:TCONS_00000448-protein
MFFLKLAIGICCVVVVLSSDCLKTVINSKGTKYFLDEIFQKYATNDKMTITEFSTFIKKFDIGEIKITCDKNDPHCMEESHNVQRRRRNLPDAYNSSSHKSHWNDHARKCLKPRELLRRNEINSTKTSITREDFVKICPSILQQIESKKCLHLHRTTKVVLGHDDAPDRKSVWLYGMLSITVISLLSLAVITMIPCLKKSFYHKIMAYLMALAVGTLAGDAMLHLIPHAFAEGANSAANLVINDEQKLKQHYSQVYRASFVLLGIYIFFLVEHLMKLKVICKGNHGHSHGGGGHTAVPVNDEERSSSPPASPGANDLDDDDDEKAIVQFDKEDEKVALKNNGAASPTLSCQSNLHSNGDGGNNTVSEGGHYHSDDRHHHHHHGEKNVTKDTKITSLAWMVIVGDGFHNFTDGLAVGVAYSASLSSGLSTTIAVFCHELPHELGDFAILISNGMSIKQAIIYNLVSAILAYLGLIAGILLGGSEMGRHFILSITAGLFLYVSLADMLPELSHQEVPNASKFSAFVCQHLGILSGFAIMLFISLYEHAI